MIYQKENIDFCIRIILNPSFFISKNDLFNKDTCYYVIGKAVEYKLMINNNPYNIPEKPLKYSKVVIEPAPLYPHQVNRKIEELDHKFPQQILKRSMMPISPYYLENPNNELPRVPMSPQPMMKNHPLQMSNVAIWENRSEPHPSQIMKELSDKLIKVNERLDVQERKLMILMEVKKYEQNTALSDYSVVSHDYGNLLSSRQMERNTAVSENSLSQTGSQQLIKLKQEINNFRSDKQKMQESFKASIDEQRESISQQLINNFRESLKDKFQEQQKKITECISEYSRFQQIKIEGKINELQENMKSQIQLLTKKLTFDYDENQKRNNKVFVGFGQQFQKITARIKELSEDYNNFKEGMLRNLSNSDIAQFQLRDKINYLVNQIQLSSKCINSQFLNVSYLKNPNQSLKLTYQQYCKVFENGKQIQSMKISEKIYFIDREGYLLDEYNYYILDNNEQKVKLSVDSINKLKETGILK